MKFIFLYSCFILRFIYCRSSGFLKNIYLNYDVVVGAEGVNEVLMFYTRICLLLNVACFLIYI